MASAPTHTPSDNQASGTAPGAIDAHTAAELIREKLQQIYDQEPGALHELEKAEETPDRSKHQEFMYQLGASGKDLATIQTEWHNYYQSLSDREKHVVWQEFYASQPNLTNHTTAETLALAEHKHQAATSGARTRTPAASKLRDIRSVQDVQGAVRHSITAGGKLKAKHHLQSLLFGLGMGTLVVFVFLFGFFNEVFIAPFIQPSRVETSTPLIVGNNGVAPTPNPEVIIPKINVEIPVNYTETTTDESVIENDLESGVVHYPTTVLPGQLGNTAYFGHSSNNIFNKGKYKFAFVLLHTLVVGDTFYLTNNSKVYVYKVISRQIVEPTDVGVLGPVAGQSATATLITCDPPGTSLHRLVVVGQQISPDPSGNTKAATPVATQTTAPATLPGNGPTLWNRLMSTSAGKATVVAAIAAVLIFTIRRFNAPSRRK
jgi:LPXTG-site transpeptidase (sortase) family protein